MKTFKIISVVAATMLFSMLLSSCAKEEAGQSVQIEQKTLKAGNAPFTWTEACAGEPIVFTIVGTGQKQIRMWSWNESEQKFEWASLASSGNNSDPLNYSTTLSAGTYYFIYRLNDFFPVGPNSKNKEDGIQVVINNCCTPGFTYVDNGGGSYTFTLIPEEDLTNAALVFTFAQGEVVEGLDGWDENGATRQKTMNLVACEPISWTVTLTPNCSGNSGNSNVWTDFKVNDVSKKGTLSNIVIPCN